MSSNDELLWESVYKVARYSATRCVRIHRNLVTADDVFQHLSLWAVEHWHKIEEWEAQDSLVFKLRRTFNNESQKFASKERAYKTKSVPSDAFYYTHEILQELLRDVWNYEQWVQSGTPADAEFISKTSKPNEGMNREAMLSDVSGSLARLNDQDKDLLRRRFDGGGNDFDVLAIEYGASEEALRKRVSRALTKLQDRLGGEQPQWNNRRYRKPDND
jgi:DNA-directed RNA polymerase specialized sigma24 family protein